MRIWFSLRFLLAAPLAAQQQPQVLTRLPVGSESAPVLINPRSIAIGFDDRIYIGDESPARVLSYDSTGKFLRAIGREGSGPGEFRSPNVGAGDVLVVNDGQLRRLSGFDTTGRLLWTKPGTCCRSRAIRVDQAGRIYVVSSPLVIGAGPLLDEMIIFSKEGVPRDTIHVPGFGSAEPGKREWRQVTKEAAFAASIPFVPQSHFAVTRTGFVVWGYSKVYTLMEGPDASVPRITIQRPWIAPSLSLTERQRAREASIGTYTRFVERPTLDRIFDLNDVPKQAPAFFALDVDACGRWWVLRTSVYMDAPATFDVYSSGGAFQASVTLAAHLTGDTLWAVGRQHMAALLKDENDAPVLGVYRLPTLRGCA